MKKSLSLLLLAMMIFLTACGTDNKISGGNDKADKVTVQNKDNSSKKKPTVKKKKTKKAKLNSKFKKAMDSYEKFIDEYVAFMKKYKKNSSDLNLLTDYSDYMNKYTKFVNQFNKWQSKNLSSAELEYYIDVQARVSKKLLNVVQ